MTRSCVGVSGSDLEAMRSHLREGQLNALRQILSDEVVLQACDSAGYIYRRRLLTPLVMVFHYLCAAIWPEDSFQAGAAFRRLGCLKRQPQQGQAASALPIRPGISPCESILMRSLDVIAICGSSRNPVAVPTHGVYDCTDSARRRENSAPPVRRTGKRGQRTANTVDFSGQTGTLDSWDVHLRDST